MDGSRSGGLLAATWAAMVSLGRAGYRRYAEAIFATSSAMQDAVRSHPGLRILGAPSFLFSFTSDDYDVYHVNDFLRTRGWRLNGQQYPNAIHMDVTRPQTQPGVAERWATDLADAVAVRRGARDRARQVRRHLRRGRRRDDRRGRRVHPLGHGRHDGPAERAARCPLTCRATSASAIDLGTGGPKVGLVDLDGTVLSSELHSVTTTFGPGGSATPGRRGVVGRSSVPRPGAS